MSRTFVLMLTLFLAAGVTFAFSSSAHAQAFAGVHIRGGLASLDEETVDADMGFGFGGRVYGGYKVMPTIGVGANFDYSWYTHGAEMAVPMVGTMEIDWSVSQPSAGLFLRADVIPMVSIDFIANYVFGSVTSEASGDGVSSSNSVDVSGLQLGLDALYRIQIPPFKTYIEVGPHFNYSWLEGENAPENSDPTNYFTFGLVAQGHFELGL